MRINKHFILFHTADGCARIMEAAPTWRPTPTITVPLSYPPRARDWMNEDLTDDDLLPPPNRIFQLMTEEPLKDGESMVYTYREIR